MDLTEHSAQATLTIVTPTGIEEKEVSFILKTDLAEESAAVLNYAMQATAMAIANAFFEGQNEG